MYNAKNHTQQGGDVSVIGGELKIEEDAKVTAAGTQAAAITDLAADANGAAIATAVNAIIAALEGVGIVAAGE